MNLYTRKAAATLFAGALAFGLAACGDDDDSTTADKASGSAPAGPETVDVTAVDYSYQGLPAEVAAGSKISLKNSSAKELHEFVAVRLPDSETRSVKDLLALPEEQLGSLFSGEPAAVILAPPGADGIAVAGDGTLAESGRYLVLCAIPTGADPDAYMAAVQAATDGPPDVPGGPPHFVSGMSAELRVK